ncbi:MAG: hypothetical protein DI629_13475 [Mesorhizobium amorphae]|nr:MAG: hypothetical protein DI629_13475 [Mesorhizobium amorphae]
MSRSRACEIPDGANRLLVIGCGMLAREILAVKAAMRLDHIDLTCLPADFHFHPDRITPGVRAAVAEAREKGYREVFVAYGDCGTGGQLDDACAELGVSRIEGPHCFAFYQGNTRFAEIGEDDMLSFYMTDFLCRQFDAFFIRPLGLDRHPELVRDYFGHYRNLVYLAQTDDPRLDQVAEDAAKMLGLHYERRFTGYGDLVPALVARERAARTKP